MASFVGVTKCPVGIAHTYMAAEKLQKTGQTDGYKVKVETQGASGTEDNLTADEIKAADFVVLAIDVAIDGMERFVGKRVVFSTTAEAIKDPQKLVDEGKHADVYTGEKQHTAENEADAESEDTAHEQSPVIKQLLNGVSHMIPFVVIGGLFIALSIALGGHATAKGMVVAPNTIWSTMNQIGNIGFSLMIPILAGFIAYAIAGRAALAPAMVGAMVSNTPAILGTKAGTGFLGAILVGYAAGYLTKWMNSWPIPKSLRAVMPIFVIPLLGTAIISAAFVYLLGSPISWLMTALQNLLTFLSKSPSTSVVLGLVLGAMVSIDMGGPINKVAFLFGVASITAGTPEIMGAVACAIAVPPLSSGIATLFKSELTSDEEKTAGVSAILMGLIGITEGAIPLATAHPKQVFPGIIIGSGVASAVGMVFHITDAVPHGGPIVGVLGATNNLGLFFLSILIGVIVSTAIIVFLKQRAVAHQKSMASAE
ncbi:MULTISPECIES: PTS fructose transporter subunit IIC [Lacticaseibacillus]|uniref:PTS system fructose-specific IIC component n=1 Tax=Lacticaseibacillus casei DSM 20011 = JCM 1134 = ATCC 393 TaxID=1423732 RepID=A0AAD1AMR3_LACCA|nr:PTS fructose transporter subunit IIBC [Lacticaseibacillus casei]HAJ54424.1 PTS fructose transporter subunit IIBC [Lactobacillus sp.]MBI6597957.1 PTS transporter subunit EIIC [Lacticaseibacillus casei]MBO1481658.1 PTS transporter subunit EIIC [Lacticaseibacillus casei]MBO2416941.1 PTS transporter subunit EIIC [Lacticaseibacillus casei]MCK2081308.1 PTS transporter subunit EIIC [Lacticaseibacillus casei]